MSFDENTQIFIAESNELLNDMENALLELERSPNDIDLINRVFRAAHTIKGSAGLFGFSHIISFTHVVENLLDDVRKCTVPVNNDLISLFMRVKDHMVSMIQNLVDETPTDENEEIILLRMLNASKADKNNEKQETITKTTITHEEHQSGNLVVSDHWHISIRLGTDTFRQGFKPQLIFEQLTEMGEIISAKLVTDSIPLLENYDPESCYLGWEILLKTDVDKNTISGIFDFFHGAKISILPPKSLISDYQDMLESLAGGDEALGKILVEIGALTGSELQQALNQQKESGGLTGDILIEQGAVQPEVVNSAVKKQQQTRAEKQRELNFVRVDSKKLDKLVTLVGELVINGAKVSQLASYHKNEDLNGSLEEMTLTLEDMRETALGLRMVPIANSFNRFHRVIRDTSKELNKKIRLEIIGGETELDKTVIERIGDPLMHLIRNSMDHGIESPIERTKAGKPEEGVIELKAFHETGTIVIKVSDDGGGLNPQKLLKIAKERGVLRDDQSLSENEIYKLIFEPGFSTAESVSNISGRGVGMDVVRRNIESLRGSISVNSTLGKGVTMTIRLPLTLAIIDGFHICVSNESFIIPLDMLDECVTMTETQKQEADLHNYINLRDEVLPLIHMNNYFGLSPKAETATRMNIVVVKFAGRKLGLLVDKLHGEAQAVVKPLGRVFQGVRGFAGFTILGSGQLALVLDIQDLAKSAIEHEQLEQYQQLRSAKNSVDQTLSIH
ncbi:MAG: chemotaxis protein CheA [Gammaproteobacteria bacterium]|nr:chemotaxis protein CheA [Gammaproteobacteria bacterium]